MLRLFVGIDFPPELKLTLSLICAGIPGARWVASDNLHLTLRFIGEVSEEIAGDIDAALSRLRAPSFPLGLSGIGVFTPEKPRVLWVGTLREPRLLSLREKIETALIRAGLPPETRRFSPHVTLARLYRPSLDGLRDFLVQHAGFRADPFPVSRFSLVASFPTKAGSVYEDEADYPLQMS